MDVGKLPQELLAQLLAKVGRRDPRVVVGPKVGEDAAVIDLGPRPGGRLSGRLLVAKSDPITFATDLIGWYAVQVNANDVACMGAKPAWFLATILLPEGATPELAATIFDQLLEACRAMEIELVGGHTEITHRLERPIVVGAMLGEVERERLVTGAGARPGDALILSKGIAIEGTALLAREAASELRALGVGEETIEEAKGYIFAPGISVVRDALTACGAAKLHTMHDPTEGGLATALHEIATAAGVGIRVSQESITVLAATEQVCRATNLDPLGLLASGALLIAVDAADAGAVTTALTGAGIDATAIGRIVSREEEVIIEQRGKAVPVPRFARDEVARFLAQRGTSSHPDLPAGRQVRRGDL